MAHQGLVDHQNAFELLGGQQGQLSHELKLYVLRLTASDGTPTVRGYPKEVRTDNGPEFTCRAFMTWAQKHGIEHILIEPGSPTQKAVEPSAAA